MDKIKVSVIVPIYNVEPYLAECLDSLERQTLKSIEVIMVNDGSTDNSAEIAMQYEHRNDNFSLINRSNGGLSAARNTGMEYAKGEYILFLDSDDYLVDDALEILYNESLAKGLDILHFVAYTFTDDNRELIWKRENGYKYNGNYEGIYNGLDLLQLFIDNIDNYYPSCCMILIKHSIIKQNELSFYEGIIHEDNPYHLQLLAACKRAGVLNEPLYCRRIRKNSITQTIDYKKKFYAMYISTITSDDFFNRHSELCNDTIDHYIGAFIYNMMMYWQELSPLMRSEKTIRECCRKIKPYARKYNYFHSKRLFLFTFSRVLFVILVKKTTVNNFP